MMACRGVMLGGTLVCIHYAVLDKNTVESGLRGDRRGQEDGRERNIALKDEKVWLMMEF